MIMKPKPNTKRKDSHSRQYHSNLRSTSKSTQKNKQRSDSKLILKLKQQDPSQHSDEHSKNRNYQLSNRLNLKKTASSKQTDNGSQYYNHFKIKSKSKGKICPVQDEAQKQKYINSVYMHKDSIQAFSVSNLQQPNKCIENDKFISEKNEKLAHTNLNILNKIKMIQKNCGIDSNGKILAKEPYKTQDHTKNIESLNTISMFQGEKKQEKFKKKQKTRRDFLKGAKSKKQQEKLSVKLLAIRSAEKIMKKKQFKDVNSPCLADSHVQADIFGMAGQNEKVRRIRKDCVVKSINSKTMILEQTRTSPNHQVEEAERISYNVNAEDIIALIEDQRKCNLDIKKLKKIYGSDLAIQRKKGIKLISKICADFSTRREGHSLAIFYMDKYLMILDQEVNSKQLKMIAMTALLLGLKMDDGITARRICHQYLSNMDILLAKSEPKNKSLQKQKQLISTFSSKENSASMAKPKSQNSFPQLNNTAKGEQTKKSRKQQVTHSKQMAVILSLQLDIMIKFNFKMVARSAIYWVDTLTALWDKYISYKMRNQYELLFRHQKNKRNLSHCYQIIQKMQQQLEVYQFSKPVTVLSTMYLIIRMRLQQQKDGQTDRKIYAKYSQSLIKSNNLIFYDNVGINQFFGDFLQELDMNISNLIECIRFVGRFLVEDFKVFTFNSKGKQILSKNHQYNLSIYQLNSSLYKLEDP